MLKKIIFALIAAGGLFAALPAIAQAADLDVNFESTPLFNEINLAPGKSVTKYIDVTNNTSATQQIGIETINENDEDGLASQFTLLIKQGEDILYEKSLKEFFDEGEVHIGDVSAGSTVKYYVTLSFNAEADDDYQGKTGGFDLLVGILGQEGGGGGRSGGGGGGLPPGLSIYEDRIYVTDITQTSAIVHWTTSYNSTSQVVYAGEGESYSFVINPEIYYGYPHAAPVPEDANKVTAHAVQLIGLTPETLYHFRVVSHASPPTVSYEHQFTTLPPEQVAGELTVAPGLIMPEIGEAVAMARPQVAGESVIAEQGGQVLGEETAKTVAGEAGKCVSHPWWYVGYIIYAILLFAALWLLRKAKKPWSYIISTILLVAALLWWWLEPCAGHLWYWPAAVVAYFALMDGWRLYPQGPGQEPPQSVDIPSQN